jgi:hypothetical protein
LLRDDEAGRPFSEGKTAAELTLHGPGLVEIPPQRDLFRLNREPKLQILVLGTLSRSQKAGSRQASSLAGDQALG